MFYTKKNSEKVDNMLTLFRCFDTVHECDKQTDGQNWCSNYRAV